MWGIDLRTKIHPRVIEPESGVPQRQRRARFTLHTAFGIFFFVLGTIALIHPNFILSGQPQYIISSNEKTLVVKHKVISIPRAASATEVVLGIGLIIFGSLAPPRRRFR